MKRTLCTLLCASAFSAASAQEVDIKIPEQQRPISIDTRVETSKNEKGLLNKGPRLDELPAPVIQRVKQYPLQVADIDVEKWDGKTVYEIEFKTEGINKRIHVKEDGTLV